MQTLVRHNRDFRIDFFRGFALWCMFIDHLNKSWLRAITLKEYGFCDGAELFVLLSGISAGIVYERAMVREGLSASVEFSGPRGIWCFSRKQGKFLG